MLGASTVLGSKVVVRGEKLAHLDSRTAKMRDSAVAFHTNAQSFLVFNLLPQLAVAGKGHWRHYEPLLKKLVEHDVSSLVAVEGLDVLRSFLGRAITHNLKESKTKSKLPARWDLLARVIVASAIPPITIPGYSESPGLQAAVTELPPVVPAALRRSRAAAVSNVVMPFETYMRRDVLGSDELIDYSAIAEKILTEIVNDIPKKSEAGKIGFVDYCRHDILKSLRLISTHDKAEVIKCLKSALLTNIVESAQGGESGLYTKFKPTGSGVGAPEISISTSGVAGVIKVKVSKTFSDGLEALDQHLNSMNQALAAGPGPR